MGEERAVIIVNDSVQPRYALAVELTGKQMQGIEQFENRHPFMVHAFGSLLGVYHYQTQRGGRYFTEEPFSLEQVIGYSNKFVFDNVNGYGEVPISTIIAEYGDSAGLGILDPLRYLYRKDIWNEPSRLEMEITIGRQGQARVEYSVGNDKYLEIWSIAKCLANKFTRFIKADETGLYIDATEQLLEDLLRKAEEGAVKIDSLRSKGYCNSYDESLTVARNVAKRLNPPREISHEKFEQLYQAAWNSRLEQDMPTIIEDMTYQISAMMHREHRYNGLICDLPGEDLKFITRLLSAGKIKLDDNLSQKFASVIALNRMLDDYVTNREIVHSKAKISGIDAYIIDLQAEKLTECGKLDLLLKEEGSMKAQALKNMTSLLSVFYKGSIPSLVRQTKPIDIGIRDLEEELPF